MGKNHKKLDNVLSELNSNIKKDKSLKEKGEIIEAVLEESSNLIENAIVESSDTTTDIESTPSAKHIEVTHVEVVSDEEDSAEIESIELTEKEKKIEDILRPKIPKTKKKQVATKIERKTIRPKKTRKQRMTAILGFIMTCFVLIGVFTTAKTAVIVTHDVVTSQAKKKELQKVIFPLVIIDVPEFDNPKLLDNSAIISSAIWEFIISNDDKSKYQKDDFGFMYVPDTDIEYYVRKLYGNDVKIEHQSIEDASVQMIYNPEKKCYYIESTPKFLPYTPRVDKITRSGDNYTVKVSYVLPDAMWNLDDNREDVVQKVMEFKLKKNKTSYQILSVKLLEVTGIDSSQLTEEPIQGLTDEGEETSSEETVPSSQEKTNS